MFVDQIVDCESTWEWMSQYPSLSAGRGKKLVKGKGQAKRRLGAADEKEENSESLSSVIALLD